MRLEPHYMHQGLFICHVRKSSIRPRRNKPLRFGGIIDLISVGAHDCTDIYRASNADRLEGRMEGLNCRATADPSFSVRLDIKLFA